MKTAHNNTEAAPKTKEGGDCPGGQMVKNLHFYCRGCGFDPWWGIKIPHAIGCTPPPKKKKEPMSPLCLL